MIIVITQLSFVLWFCSEVKWCWPSLLPFPSSLARSWLSFPFVYAITRKTGCWIVLLIDCIIRWFHRLRSFFGLLWRFPLCRSWGSWPSLRSWKRIQGIFWFWGRGQSCYQSSSFRLQSILCWVLLHFKLLPLTLWVGWIGFNVILWSIRPFHSPWPWRSLGCLPVCLWVIRFWLGVLHFPG